MFTAILEFPRHMPSANKDTANIINVLVVDDSAVVRQVLESILSQEPDMSVLVGSRGDFSLGEFMREIVSSG